MYWMDLSGGDPEFYGDLLGWRAADGLFTMDGQVVAGYGSPGAPGWNLHGVVADVAAVCAAAERHGGTVVTVPGAEVAVVADPAGAAFVVRGPGRVADLVNKPMAFTWAELCTPDYDGARSFYSAVFGWSLGDITMAVPAGTVDYTVFLAGTEEAGGLLPAEGAFAPAPPPYWLAYVQAADTDALAARAADLGGAVVVEPFDIPRIGRIAVLAGRAGETFALMQMP